MANIGKLIVLEGVDGSGISTQTALIKDWFSENPALFGKSYFTKEPTDGPVGGLLRLALAKRLKPLDERIMALLFAADRLDHLYCTGENEQKEGIRALLKQGFHVVTDRYYLSSLAYQSLRLDLDWLRQINRYIIKPDLTILLQVPVEQSAFRRNQSRIHEELYERAEYLSVIGKNYENIARLLLAEGENIVTVDGTQEKNLVFRQIQQAILELIR